ncbi:adenosylcobinamide kinase/adenosylcobinamide phosphate guanyltransferase [Spirochaetia bacterium]|nr:adenosylcobinamide kinase/adenosylcobinamide phosphate guanyltransferase [Spirochaetia bacterium]
MITLITGGVKSGKSHYALETAAKWGFPVSFIATAEVLDNEMKDRITRHRTERAEFAGTEAGFVTIEEPLELDAAMVKAGNRAVVDCLPMWVNNMIFYEREADFDIILDAFIKSMQKKENCVVVTNETGLGNIPFDEMTRRYNRLLAESNRKIAAAADSVQLMVSGIPLRIK